MGEQAKQTNKQANKQSKKLAQGKKLKKNRARRKLAHHHLSNGRPIIYFYVYMFFDQTF